jgi:glutamine cyclotransferase
MLSLVVLLVGISSTAPAQAPSRGFEVVAVFPHDSDAFTEGLDFVGKRFFEGTGLYGESDLRLVELSTGDIKRKKEKSQKYFGEGVTVFKDRIYQLTYQEEVAFVYALKGWRQIRKFSYKGEGWGLTHNGRHLIMSNGSDEIVFRDPKTFAVRRRIAVTDNGASVSSLNELEWVKGDILANVWPSDDIVRIDPDTGGVTARYDMSSLRAKEEESGDPEVTNGIAYMSGANRLFVTGKNWAHVYEITLNG